jgi:hypothetical protein
MQLLIKTGILQMPVVDMIGRSVPEAIASLENLATWREGFGILSSTQL